MRPFISLQGSPAARGCPMFLAPSVHDYVNPQRTNDFPLGTRTLRTVRYEPKAIGLDKIDDGPRLE